MTDAVPEAVRSALDDPFTQPGGAPSGTRSLHFEVDSTASLSPSLRRIELRAAELDGFRYRPGQDVMLLVGATGSRPIRRRYTIRRLDPSRRTLTLDIVLHADGPGTSSPGERWVRAARPGDHIEGIGPRGKIFADPAAEWHLFIGDESAMPAILAMAESLPGDAVATLVIEVPDPADEQDFAASARTLTSWLHRIGRPAGDPGQLVAEARAVDVPRGDGHAYLLGEAKVVLALREVLTDRGLRPEQISAKAYWGRNRANAEHGEPLRT